MATALAPQLCTTYHTELVTELGWLREFLDSAIVPDSRGFRSAGQWRERVRCKHGDPAPSSQSGMCAAVTAQSGTIIGVGAALDCQGGVPLLCAPALQFQSGTRILVMPLGGAKAECGEGNCRSSRTSAALLTSHTV